MITISAFKWVPDFARGQVRDLRVRWALEEAGLPYTTRLLEQGEQEKPDYRAQQPFGQVPIFEENGFILFETGAIVLHIGERSEALLPKEANARARATQWLIAALNSIEPFVMNVAIIDLFYANEEWAKLRRPGAVEFAQKRLAALSTSLGDKPFLDGDRFTAGDLMMTTVLRILKHTDIVTSDRRLAAYIEPFVMNVAIIDLFYANEEWAKLRRPGAVEFAQKRLGALSTSLGDKPFLDGDRFTAGDLMMTTVLRILKHTDIVTSDRRLAAYIERCSARPAFKRAFDAQIGDFKDAA